MDFPVMEREKSLPLLSGVVVPPPPRSFWHLGHLMAHSDGNRRCRSLESSRVWPALAESGDDQYFHPSLRRATFPLGSLNS